MEDLKLQKAMANAKQYDHEDAAQYIVRMNKLRTQEADLVENPTPEEEFVGSIINGLRGGYNALTTSWALDEIRGDAENAGPSTIEEVGNLTPAGQNSFQSTQWEQKFQ